MSSTKTRRRGTGKEGNGEGGGGEVLDEWKERAAYRSQARSPSVFIVPEF